MRMKQFSFLFFVISFILIMSFDSNAFGWPKYAKEPAYPIYPNTATDIAVESEEVNWALLDTDYGMAHVENHYVLKNTSGDNEILKFFYPQLGPANLKISTEDNLLAYNEYKILCFGYSYQSPHNPVDYPVLANYLTYVDAADFYAGRTVNVYDLPPNNKPVDFLVRLAPQSVVITRGLVDYGDQDEYTYGHKGTYFISREYLIDFNKDMKVYINGAEQNPLTDVPFKDAFIHLIKITAKPQPDDTQAELFYNLITRHDRFFSTVATYDRSFYDNSVLVNQYELAFAPGEEKTLDVSYDIFPSYYVTDQKDNYYTYILELNEDNWKSFGDYTINLTLNDHYRYLLETSTNFSNTVGHTYQATLTPSINKSISFSTYTKDEIPNIGPFVGEFSGLGDQLTVFLGIILGLLLLGAVAVVALAVFVIFIMVRKIKKV